MNKTLLKWLGVAEKKAQEKKTLVFQLFWGKEDDLIEAASELVNQRKFTEVMRIGLKIVPALMRGDIEPLFEAFPWVKVELLEYMRELQPKPALPAPVSSSLSPQVEKYLQEILTKLDKPQPMIGNSSELRQLGAPVFDDDNDNLLTVTKDKSSGKNATQNFLRSMAALSGEKLVEDKPKPSGGIKSLDAQQFAAPTFEDD